MSNSTTSEVPVHIGASAKTEETANTNSKTKGSRGKKELRNVEQQILKSDLSAEEKLEVLVKKYAEVIEENRTCKTNLKAYERQLQVLQKEKEQLRTENGRVLLARSRLEELCRELQRQNKAIKEESTLQIREEEERRKEVSGKFQSTLSEVSTLLQQNNEKNSKLREENSEMAGKLQLLCDQYAAREEHLEKLAKQYEIERQLNEAKLAKVRMEAAEAKEKMLHEKQKLLLELNEYQKRCQTMHEEEVALRQQLAMYTEKYDDFQKALTVSNRTFVGFKDQMDAMTKKLRTLEKETASWKQRWEKSNSTLLEMATAKKQCDAELLCAKKQLEALQKLCRALQTERTALLQKIKGQNESSPESVNASDTTSPMQLPNADISAEDNQVNASDSPSIKDDPSSASCMPLVVDTNDMKPCAEGCQLLESLPSSSSAGHHPVETPKESSEVAAKPDQLPEVTPCSPDALPN